MKKLYNTPLFCIPLMIPIIIWLNNQINEVHVLTDSGFVWWILSFVLYAICMVYLLFYKFQVTKKMLVYGFLEFFVVIVIIFSNTKIWSIFMSRLDVSILVFLTFLLTYVYLLLRRCKP